MKKKLLVFSFVGIVLALGTHFAQKAVEPGPFYQNKSLTYWVKAALIYSDHWTEFRAVREQFGPAVVPLLVDTIRRHASESHWKQLYTGIRGKLPESLGHPLPAPLPAETIRDYGLQNLVLLWHTNQPGSITAAQALIQLMQDPNGGLRYEAVRAVDAFFRRLPPAHATLTATTAHKNEVLKTLIQALQDPRPQVRRQATKSVIACRPVPEQAVDALTKSLEDVDENVRIGAALSLAAIGRGDNKTTALLGNPVRAQHPSEVSPIARTTNL